MSQLLVAIATRDRPERLRRCVDSVLRQELDPDDTLTVVVIDNDSDPPVTDLPDRVVLVREPRRGIPFARNRAVAEARSLRADYLAFVDDDEFVEDTTWLVRMVRFLEENQVDIVTGPVDPEVPPGTARYVASHPFFRRNRSFPSGTAIRDAYTNNVLVRRNTFERTDFVFSEAMVESGGSDTELFRRLRKTGTRILWCEEAAVRETIPPRRATATWVVQRSWRLGTNRAQRLRIRGAPFPWVVIFAVAGLAEAVVGTAGAAAWIVSPAFGLRALGRAARGAGTVAGALLGMSSKEYRTPI